MANNSKYDVMLNLYRKTAGSIMLAPELLQENVPNLAARKKLLEDHFIICNLNYEVIKSISDLDGDELQSELDCRNISFEKFGQKVARNYNKAVQTILFYGLLESFGISVEQIAEDIKMMALESKILLEHHIFQGLY